jgi:hypothetical protein
MGTDLIVGPPDDGTNTGDILRWNASTGKWEKTSEPFVFTEINLTPKASSSGAEERYFIAQIKAYMWGWDESKHLAEEENRNLHRRRSGEK